MKLRSKLLLGPGLLALGILISGVYSNVTMNETRIGGALYRSVNDKKDVIADILPPPMFLVETYLTVLRMQQASLSGNAAAVESLEAVYRDKLKREFDERRTYWVQNLEKGEVRDLLLGEVVDTSAELFRTVDDEFLPAIETADSEKSGAVLPKIEQLYLKNRDACTKTVELSSRQIEGHVASAESKSSSGILLSISLVLFVIVAGVLVNFLISRKITRTIGEVVRVQKSFAEGGLTSRVNVSSRDELGELGAAVNSFGDTIQGLIRDVQRTAQTLKRSVRSSKDTAETMALAAEEMRAYTDNSVAAVAETNGAVNTVAAAAEESSSNMNAIAAAVEQMSASVSNVAAGAEEMSANVNSVSAAIEEMSASLREVAQNCQQSAVASSESSSKANDAMTQMATLADAAKRIGKVVELIEDIADQTNLLALNATIEAASAGEAGKGFAVVAGEVKDLARQTAKATDEIAQQVSAMQSDTQTTVQMIRRVAELSEQVNSLTSMISAAVEEQSATTNEISRNMSASATAAQEISNGVQQTSSGLGDMSRGTSDVSLALTEIARSTAEAAGGATVASSSVADVSMRIAIIAEAAAGLDEEAASLSTEADSLIGLVTRFEV